MRVEVLKTYPQLSKAFKKGDILTMSSVLEKEDRFIHVQKRKERVKVQVAIKGNFKDYLVECENGDVYSGNSIRHAIGYVKIDKIFKKLD